MKSNGTSKRPFFVHVVATACSLLIGIGLVSCAEQRPLDREITEVRPAGIRPGSGPGRVSPSGMASSENRASGSSSGPKFVWDTPDGWTELAPTQLRAANFVVDAESNAECYLTVLPGMGGGLVDNVNRWRNQIGLAPQSTSEIEALPKRPLFGNPATIVELEGAYKGMGDNAVPGSALLGAILAMPEGMLFVKMTGPADVVSANRAAFDSFCDSLDLDMPGEEHDHSSHAPGAHDEAVGASSTGSSGSSGGLAWTAPDSWTADNSNSMRVANYRFGESGESECYIAVLGGNGGGVEMNVNRWRSQVGADELSQAEIMALPTLKILGVDSPWMEAYGDFSGIGADDLSNAGIKGAICELEGQALFVKMLGPASELREQHDNFISFCESIRAE